MATDDPISATLALVGGVVSAGATIYQGQVAANAANYNRIAAQNNAIAYRQAAQASIEAGQQQAANKSLQEAEEGGKIVASEAAGNVDVNTGSNRAVRTSQRELGALDIQTVLHNAQLQQYGYNQEAVNQQASAGLYAYEAETAPIGADIGAAGQAFGAASKYYTPQAPQAPGPPLNILPT